LIEYLNGTEPAAARVDRVLARERPVVSWINLGEVAYYLERTLGQRQARLWVENIRGGLTLDVPVPERVLAAASVKARYAMSYEDAFAVATAQAYDAVLLTGDPEILGAEGGWRTENLRTER